MRLASGTTDQFIYFVAVDATDLSTRETGLAGKMVVARSRNGGAMSLYTTPTVNEVDTGDMTGVYELQVDEDTTIDAGDFTQEYALNIVDTGGHMAPVTRVIELFRPPGGDTGQLNVNVTAFEDTGVNDRLASIQADTDTGIRHDVTVTAFSDTGVNNRLAEILADTDTGIQSAVNVRQIKGDTGAADVLQKRFADTGVRIPSNVQEWLGTAVNAATAGYPDINVERLDNDTGAADRLQKFAGNKLDGAGQLDTGTGQTTNTLNVTATAVEDTGSVSDAVWNSLKSSHGDTGSFGEELGQGVNVVEVAGDTGAADILQKRHADTGVTLRANVEQIDGDTGAADILAKQFADTGYTLRANVEQIDSDTGAADRLREFAGEKLSSTAQVDTGTLAGTQAGTIDANVTHVNETEVAGSGSPDDQWGPA